MRGGFVAQQKGEGRHCSIEGRPRAAARAGEGRGAVLGAALMASGVATALSPSTRRVVACGGAEAQQRCRQGPSKAVLPWRRQRAGLHAGRAGRGVIGSALGKQESRAEEGERGRRERERERERSQRVDFDFSQIFQLKLEKF